MEIKKVSCPSCGAPMFVTEGEKVIVCNFCHTSLAVEFTGEDVSLKLAAHVEKTVREIGDQTTATIREGIQTTQLELKRIQLQQQFTFLVDQLGKRESEIRSLEATYRNGKQNKQLKELKKERDTLAFQIKSYENNLYGAGIPPMPVMLKTKSPFWSGCLTAFLVYLGVGGVLGWIGMGIDKLIFGSEEGAATPFFNIAVIIGLVAGILGFIYKASPNSVITTWMKDTLGKMFKKKSPK